MQPCLLTPQLSLFSEIKQLSSERRAPQTHSGAAGDDTRCLNPTHQPLVGPAIQLTGISLLRGEMLSVPYSIFLILLCLGTGFCPEPGD